MYIIIPPKEKQMFQAFSHGQIELPDISGQGSINFQIGSYVGGKDEEPKTGMGFTFNMSINANGSAGNIVT